MKIKAMELLAIFIVLFSLPSLSQATVKSKRPKMDAYYPPKQMADTPQTKLPPQTNNEATTVTSTPVITTAVAPPPVVTASAPPPAVTIAPVKTVTKVVPVIKKSEVKPPPPSPYFDTRKGSSTPQYDTWNKNNYGAGSVTTSPK